MQSMAAAISLCLFNPSPIMKIYTSKPTKPATLLLIPHPHNILNLLHSSASGISIAAASAAAFSLPVFILPPEALSAGGEFGILEGRTLALVHPLVMGSLFFYTLWTGYLGWQWRRVRTIQDEINDFKKQVKSPAPAATASGLVGAYQEPVPMPLESPSPVELNVIKLTEERKQLLKGGYRDRHFNAGSILLGFGVLESVGGALNTWLRTGKLFPGPHLFAGAGITVLWALAAALVPLMQKGNETARNLHIVLNTLNVLLFLCQIPTGIEIVLKVFEFTKWP